MRLGGVRAIGWLLLALGLLPGRGSACPCVDTAVVHVVEAEQRLIATVSETSRVMITAALYELLLEEIQPRYGDWVGAWRVSFYTTAAAAARGEGGAPHERVAEYDRAQARLTLWPGVPQRREQIELEIK